MSPSPKAVIRGVKLSEESEERIRRALRALEASGVNRDDFMRLTISPEYCAEVARAFKVTRNRPMLPR